jgi:outer membrane receptor protein involved in Fe transport
VGNSTDIQNTRRIWRNVQEENDQVALNLSAPFVQWFDAPGLLKAGAYVERTDRTYAQDTFSHTISLQAPGQSQEGAAARACNNSRGTFTSSPGANLWTDVFLDPTRSGASPGTLLKDPEGGVWCDFLEPFYPNVFPERSVAPDSPNQLILAATPFPALDTDYDGQQAIDAAYAMAELPVTRWLELSLGARYETTEIEVIPRNEEFGLVWTIVEKPDVDVEGNPTGTFTRFINRETPEEQAASLIESSDLLPAFSATFSVMRNMRVLGAWSRTVARPTFRELAPVATEEFIDGDAFVGRNDLLLTKITNYDLRWEWFRRPGELLAVSAYHKELRDPIELISFVVENTPFIQPKTYERGEVSGIEFELRQPLDRVWRGFRGLALGMNVAQIRSSVEMLEEERLSLEIYDLGTETRRLQGQPDRLFNANLTYDHPRHGLSMGLFYNLTGETLLTGAARGGDEGATPDVILESLARLDFKISKRLGRNFSVSFRGANLTAPVWRSVYRLPDDSPGAVREQVREERATARAFSMSANYTW